MKKLAILAVVNVLQLSSANAQLSEGAPLISGPVGVLWGGVGVFFLVLFLVLVAIIRWRVIKPAKQKASRQQVVFEPAGAGAEITFEDEEVIAADPDPSPIPPKDTKKEKRKKLERKRRGENASIGDLNIEADAREHKTNKLEDPETPPETNEKPALFNGLFGRKQSRDDETVKHSEPAIALADDEPLETTLLPSPPEDFEDRENPAPEWLSQTDRDADQRAAIDSAELERQKALDEAAAIRAVAEAQQRRIAEERAAKDREAEFERRKMEAAIEQRLHSLSEMQSKIDSQANALNSANEVSQDQLGAAVEERVSKLSFELKDALNAALTQLTQQIATLRADAEPKRERLDDLKSTMETSLQRLSDRIDRIGAAKPAPGSEETEELRKLNKLLAERAAPAALGSIQLNELVRNSLPAERYKFDAVLGNGASADCLILTANGTPPFSIDAGFPVEAFEKYAKANDDHRNELETAYRRAALRHLVYIAEKLIAPGETADFAIMFVPSETIYNDLHRNFGDIVQDSYRARVWITAPTSLMATLHVMAAADARFAQNNRALQDEIGEINRRIAVLESRAEQPVKKQASKPTPAPASTLAPPAATPSASPSPQPINNPAAAAPKPSQTQPATLNRKNEADADPSAATSPETEASDDDTKPENVIRQPFPLR